LPQSLATAFLVGLQGGQGAHRLSWGRLDWGNCGTAVSFSDDPRLGTGNGGRETPGTRQVDQWNDRICLPVPLSHVTLTHQDSGAWAYPDKTRPLVWMDLLPVRGLVGHALMVMIRLRSSPVSSHMTPSWSLKS